MGSRKTTIYHFRGHKIKSVLDIPTESHWGVLVSRVENINATATKTTTEPVSTEKIPDIDISVNPSQVDVLDYYVFKDDEQEKMKVLVDLFYNEDPQRQDIKIIKSQPIEQKVRFVVDIDLPQEQGFIKYGEKKEEIKEDASDVANQ